VVLTEQDDVRLAREVESHLRQLMEVVLASARASEPVALAAAFAKAQRVTAWGLRSAVELGREQGVSWRDLAEVLDVPVSTLHRQYNKGAAIMTGLDRFPGLPAESSSEIPNEQSAPGLPTSIDVFVGREQELADLPELLWQRRLVSLVGPAGVGKTRLAVETAHRVRNAYPGGVWWVDLSSVSRGWLVGPAVSAAAGPQGVGRDAVHLVLKAVEAGPVLLVMDNCEHLLVDAEAIITKLCAAAPSLRVLTTSREALRGAGESIMPVAPLPPAKGLGAATRGSDAVRLFAARARDVQPDFDADRWVGVIAEICDRLDGLPLAIEFAARQSDVLEPDQLYRALAERFELLTDRGTHSRHHSLHGAIQWSYDLLDETAKAVFARLCILPGGFDQDTAAVVTSDLHLSRAQLWTVVTDLTSKSMIVAQSPRPGRFRILESLRAFGQAVLADTDEITAAQTRLIEWLSTHKRQLAENPWGDTLTGLMSRMVGEVDNVRHGVDIAAALRHAHHPSLVLLLGRVLSIGEELAEANGVLGDVVANSQLSTADRALAESLMANNAARLNDLHAASRHADRSVELARSLDDVDVLTIAVNSFMVVRGLSNDVVEGIKAGAEIIDHIRVRGRAGALGRILALQAWLLAASGDTDAAYKAICEAIALHEAHVDQTLPISERFANDWAMSMLQTAAQISIARGDDETATRYVVAILTTRFYHHRAVVGALACAAVLSARQGDYERALRLAAGAAHVAHQRDPYRDDLLKSVENSAGRAVGSAKARAATASGRAMTIIQLKKYALGGAMPADNNHPGALTPRERQVALQVSHGQTNAQIAARLSISQRTVASHLASIRAKLDLRSRVGVAIWANLIERPNDS
jgi:non-specific serine/threonine protein kinase